MARVIPFHVPANFKPVQRPFIGKLAKVLDFSSKRPGAISGLWVTIEKFLPDLRSPGEPSPHSTGI